jgi:hypothetical protein
MADDSFGVNFDSASGKYDTKLTPEEEKKYQTWIGPKAKDEEDYDTRGLFKEVKGEPLKTGHSPDTYKKPNHPTFSNESKYHSSETPGGKWGKDEKGNDFFVASEHNVKMHGEVGLQNYFNKHEKNVILHLPEKQKEKQ